MKLFSFQEEQNDASSHARAGRFETEHGTVETPCFVPVGTQGTVKTLTPEDLEEIGVNILFGNTYHLHLRPGEEIVKKFGGLGKFMGWNGPTMTDSGGFQVFSLGQKKKAVLEDDPETHVNLVKIEKDGVHFRSHIDGSAHFFTPEKSIEIQKKLGADLILAFDDCPPNPATHEQTKKATDHTNAWAERSLEAFRKKKGIFCQGLVGIIQGGVYQDLREASAKFISSLPFEGIAVGGVAVGETKDEMRAALKWVTPHLPKNKFRHLLGIGEVDDIFAAVENGIDMFDCVSPTRYGRTGTVFVSPPLGTVENKFKTDLRKKSFQKDTGPIDENCTCYACQNFTRGYIHHLLAAKEILGVHLASYHNVHFLINLVKNIRASILEGRFQEEKKKWLGR